MEGLREVLVVVPPCADDIYARHQHVWQAMQGRAHHGRAFIFAAVSPHLVRVRSACLERGDDSVLADGQLRVSLVTAHRSPDGRMVAVEDRNMPTWTRALLARHGLRVEAVNIMGSAVARGVKLDEASGLPLNIELPVRDVNLTVSIQNRGKANLAWAYGIGRGKRFGYGMLQRAG